MTWQERIQNRKRNQNGARPIRSKKQKPKIDKRGRAGPRARFEHYKKLANDAATAGDLITSEEYHQQADHYFRLIKNMPSPDLLPASQS